MRGLKLLFLSLLIAPFLVFASRGDTLVYRFGCPFSNTNTSSTSQIYGKAVQTCSFSLPAFNPSFGQLTNVLFSMDITQCSDASVNYTNPTRANDFGWVYPGISEDYY